MKSLALVIVLIVFAAPGHTREWESAKGGHKVHAKFLSKSGNDIKLKKVDGKIIILKLSQLSNHDQEIALLLDQHRKKLEENPKNLEMMKGQLAQYKKEINSLRGQLSKMRIDRYAAAGRRKLKSKTVDRIAPSKRKRNQAISKSAPPKEWYVGGTLHKKSALDWQTATPENKLATCADFVTGMWDKKEFVPGVQNSINVVTEDVLPYAKELVAFIDAATKQYPDPDENRRVYANQTVSGMSALGMVMMGWLPRSE